jgi:predicted porin
MAFASSAQAGITIPAGDWTLDIGGVVNAYYTSTRATGDDVGLGGNNASGERREANITTGLLPNYLSVSGKSRQNDLDIGFTISINPGASTIAAGRQSSQQENRQAFLTIGDASWGSVKLGKDLGIYASDAILNDMTLLGVGSGAGMLAGNTTTLGRIGSGFMYADWKSQVAYTSPNWNGFQFTAGVTQAWNATGDDASSSSRGGNSPAFEGKASYAWTGDVAGKVWVSAISQKVKNLTGAASGVYSLNTTTGAIAQATAGADLGNETVNAWDMGANVNVAGFGLTGYYGRGKGIGHVLQLNEGFDANGKRRDSQQYYVQATYALPTATKIGVSYGESKLEGNSGESFSDTTNQMWTVGAYHPLTKSMNLVAEYSDVEGKNNLRNAADEKGKAKTISLGAILFF